MGIPSVSDMLWGYAMAKAKSMDDTKVQQERSSFLFDLRQNAKNKIAMAITFTHPRLEYQDMLRCFLEPDVQEALQTIRGHVMHPRGTAHCYFVHDGNAFHMSSDNPLPLAMFFREGADKEHAKMMVNYFSEVKRLSDIRERLCFVMNKLVPAFGVKGTFEVFPELIAFKQGDPTEKYPASFGRGGPGNAVVEWATKQVMRQLKAEIVGVTMLADAYEEGTKLDWWVECESRWQPPTEPSEYETT